MSLIYPMSPARWNILQTLADVNTPLDRKQLAQLTGVSVSAVYHALIRPVIDGWVTVTETPSGRRNITKNLYEITGIGREQLAARFSGTNLEVTP